LPVVQLHPVLVNGTPGVIIRVRGRAFAMVGFTVAGGRILEIGAIADPERVRRIAAAILTDR
jgi:RNA polymerase sigma-70 factor (ECF subfamily)